jgi:hypothetical protein
MKHKHSNKVLLQHFKVLEDVRYGPYLEVRLVLMHHFLDVLVHLLGSLRVPPGEV